MGDSNDGMAGRAAGGFVSRTADDSIFSVMDKPQWGYALFDAGCWGYASVTISTLAPLVFVRRIRESTIVQRFAHDVWDGAEAEEQAVWHGVKGIEKQFVAHGRHGDAYLAGSRPYGLGLDHMHTDHDAYSSLAADWGNSTGDMGGLGVHNASGTWVMMVAVSTLAAGIACPILGALADRYSARKAVAFVTGALSIVFMTIFAFSSRHSDWQELLAVVGLGMMFTSIMHCFYNSLLMMVSGRHDMIKVACLQCMVGAWGSAILMIGLGMGSIESEEDLDRTYILYCFSIAAVWFVVLSIPMWLWLDETVNISSADFSDSFSDSWRETIKSLHNIELMKYLLALMLFNDANSTLHAVHMVYGAQIGLPIEALMLGAVFNRVVGGFAALAWLGVAQLADARLCFMGCIVSTIVAIAVCAWMTTVTEFYIVVLTMTTASSGSFIFAKVLMAMLTPKEKAAHNFGFMGMINRVAGFLGPFVFSTLAFLYDAKTGFIGLILMALCGLVVITTVDFDKGYEFSDTNGGQVPFDEHKKGREHEAPKSRASSAPVDKAV